MRQSARYPVLGVLSSLGRIWEPWNKVHSAIGAGVAVPAPVGGSVGTRLARCQSGALMWRVADWGRPTLRSRFRPLAGAFHRRNNMYIVDYYVGGELRRCERSSVAEAQQAFDYLLQGGFTIVSLRP